MTTFEKLKKIGEQLRLPCVPDIYKGEEPYYLTYNYVTEDPICADDKPDVIIDSIQLHYFCPMKENYLKTKNIIRDTLISKGFTFPEITILDDKDYRHIVFECDVESEE